MQRNGLTIEMLLDALADRVAEKLNERRDSNDKPSERRLFTVDEAAAYLGRTKASIQHLLADGALPTVRFDRRVFLDVRDLESWIEAHKAKQ